MIVLSGKVISFVSDFLIIPKSPPGRSVLSIEPKNRVSPENITLSKSRDIEPGVCPGVNNTFSFRSPSYNKKTLLKKYQKPQLKDLINEIAILKREKLPGESFVYSCLGYIVLGHIVEKISGQNLSKFAEENIFSKLEMWSTKFIPKDSIKKRISPTEVLNGNLSIGIVHDPLAQIIGGISGNAGLFSTAEDMAKFARMLLNNGYYKDKKIFSQHTVKAFTIIYPQLKKFGRSPGWDVNTNYSSSRGDLFPIGSFGHTGFTGTSIWIDPKSKVFVILLSNRVHPKRKKSIIRLYSIISNIVLSSID